MAAISLLVVAANNPVVSNRRGFLKPSGTMQRAEAADLSEPKCRFFLRNLASWDARFLEISPLPLAHGCIASRRHNNTVVVYAGASELHLVCNYMRWTATALGMLEAA